MCIEWKPAWCLNWIDGRVLSAFVSGNGLTNDGECVTLSLIDNVREDEFP